MKKISTHVNIYFEENKGVIVKYFQTAGSAFTTKPDSVHLYFLPQSIFDKFPVRPVPFSDGMIEQNTSSALIEAEREWSNLPNLLDEQDFSDIPNLYEASYHSLLENFKKICAGMVICKVYFSYHDSEHEDLII